MTASPEVIRVTSPNFQPSYAFVAVLIDKTSLPESIVKVPINKWSNSMLKEVIDKIEVNTNGIIKINWKVEKY